MKHFFVLKSRSRDNYFASFSATGDPLEVTHPRDALQFRCVNAILEYVHRLSNESRLKIFKAQYTIMEIIPK